MKADNLDLGSAFGAVAASLTSAAAGICCIGPLALTLLGVNGMILAAGITPYRGYLLATSLLLIGLAFWVARRRQRGSAPACDRRASRITKLVLYASVFFWVGAVILNIVADRLWL